MDFRNYSLQGLANDIQTKKISAREVTEAALENIDKYDGKINAFCSVNHEDAINAFKMSLSINQRNINALIHIAEIKFKEK